MIDSLLLKGIAALIVSVGIYFAWESFAGWVSAPRVTAAVAKQVKHDQATVDKAVADKDDSDRRAKDSASDLSSCKVSLGKQNDAVIAWTKAANSNAAIVTQRTKERDAARAQVSAREQELLAITKAPPSKDQSCQQKLDATDKLLRDARARAMATKTVQPVPK